jgi:hypothetical protein
MPTPARTAARLAVALAAWGVLLSPATRAAPPVRKGGTVTVTLSGARTATGTYPAICGPYLMMDVKGVGKAGDGLVFEADVPAVGRLQVSSAKRVAGRSAGAGLVLNTSTASYVGDGAAPGKVVFGPGLDTASVAVTLRNLRARRGGPKDEIVVKAEFDCSR